MRRDDPDNGLPYGGQPNSGRDGDPSFCAAPRWRAGCQQSLRRGRWCPHPKPFSKLVIVRRHGSRLVAPMSGRPGGQLGITQGMSREPSRHSQGLTKPRNAGPDTHIVPHGGGRPPWAEMYSRTGATHCPADFRNCQTLTASLAEPGDLPWLLVLRRRLTSQ
jgi:hypothetical protein